MNNSKQKNREKKISKITTYISKQINMYKIV